MAVVLAAGCASEAPEPGDTGPHDQIDDAFDDDGNPVEPEEVKADGWGSTSSPPLVLRGTIITMDEARGTQDVIENGAVVVEGTKIKAVLKAGEAFPANATVLPSATGTSDWVITPGLINSHNHLAYSTARIYRELPLYENTYQWRDESYYDTHIQYPKKVFASSSGATSEFAVGPAGARVPYDGLVGRFGEVKELVSGTTTTQGSYFGTAVPNGYGNHLVRNLDWSNFGQKRVSQQSLGILVESFDPRKLIARMDAKSIDAWLVHLLEGTDQESRDEFDCLRAMGLVRKETVLIHGTALTREQLTEMGRVGAKLIASPTDNLLYYGTVADIKTAWQVGVNVSIGTDWSSAGSKNLLVELKVLDLLNKQIYGKFFSDRDMLKMVTANPADAVGFTDKVGRIKAGLYADLAVYTKRSTGSAYRAVIDGTEADVRLVVIGGDPLYGDATVMKKLKPTDSETMGACGFEKAIDITTTSSKTGYGNITFAQVRDALDEGLKFQSGWMQSHWEPARAGSLTGAALTSGIKKAFPKGLTTRNIDPVYMCEDADLMAELRTDANIRTAFNGVCLDLRPWYGQGPRTSCNAMPAKPAKLTVAQHPGTIPQRPPAWCAGQNWSGTGALPKPPR